MTMTMLRTLTATALSMGVLACRSALAAPASEASDITGAQALRPEYRAAVTSAREMEMPLDVGDSERIMPRGAHYLAPSSIPEAWRGFDDPYFYLAVPPDPPEAARGAKSLSPTMNESTPIEIKVGERLKLDPLYISSGWKIHQAGTRAGVLWPVLGAPRVFFGRCPGESSVVLMRGPATVPAKPPPHRGYEPLDSRRLRIRVLPGDLKLAACDLALDPPIRFRNPRTLGSNYFNTAIVVKLGDTFKLAPQGDCVALWRHFTVSKPGIIQSEEGPGTEIYFKAITRGSTTISVHSTIDCGSGRVDPLTIFVD